MDGSLKTCLRSKKWQKNEHEVDALKARGRERSNLNRALTVMIILINGSCVIKSPLVYLKYSTNVITVGICAAGWSESES